MRTTPGYRVKRAVAPLVNTPMRRILTPCAALLAVQCGDSGQLPPRKLPMRRPVEMWVMRPATPLAPLPPPVAATDDRRGPESASALATAKRARAGLNSNTPANVPTTVLARGSWTHRDPRSRGRYPARPRLDPSAAVTFFRHPPQKRRPRPHPPARAYRLPWR
jgi:hypothetical protein